MDYTQKDEELFKEVERMIQGDFTNFNRMYELSVKYIYKLIYDIVKDHYTTEDLVQDTYVTIYNKIDNLDKPRSFYSWAGRIATNNALLYLRKNKEYLLLDEDTEGAGEFAFFYASEDQEKFIPEEICMDKEKQRLIADILDNLPVVQKLCVQYFYYEEMSVQEIADIFGCGTGTVKSRLNYARKAIKEAVIELDEKHGTRLYSLGAIPLLLLLFRDDIEQLIINSAGIAAGITKKNIKNASSDAPSSVPSAHAEVTKGLSTVTKATTIAASTKVALVASLCVVLGTGVGVYATTRNPSDSYTDTPHSIPIAEPDEDYMDDDDYFDEDNDYDEDDFGEIDIVTPSIPVPDTNIPVVPLPDVPTDIPEETDIPSFGYREWENMPRPHEILGTDTISLTDVGMTITTFEINDIDNIIVNELEALPREKAAVLHKYDKKNRSEMYTSLVEGSERDDLIKLYEKLLAYADKLVETEEYYYEHGYEYSGGYTNIERYYHCDNLPFSFSYTISGKTNTVSVKKIECFSEIDSTHNTILDRKYILYIS